MLNWDYGEVSREGLRINRTEKEYMDCVLIKPTS